MPEIAAEKRRDIAAGAREIAIDDFVDSALSERPKTGAPPAEPIVPAAPPRMIRETVRGIGAPNESRAGQAPRPATPRTPAVFEAPDTEKEAPRFSASTANFIAVKDQRISELEEQLAKAKQQLEKGERRPLAPAVRTVPMQAVAQAVPRAPVAPSPKAGGTLFMPVTTAPPALAPRVAPVAPAPPPPAPPLPPPGVGATLFMPSNHPAAPKAHPSAQYPAVLDPSLNAAYSQPAAPNAHPSAQYPAVLDPRLQSAPVVAPVPAAPPAARPSAVIKSLLQQAIEQGRAPPPSPGVAMAAPAAPPPPDDDDTGGRTMMLAPPDAADDDDGGGRTMMLDASMQPPALGIAPAVPVGFAPVPSGMHAASQPPLAAPPAHLVDSTEKTFERQAPAPFETKKRGVLPWLAVAAVLAIGLAGGAYAFRMGLGPFASTTGEAGSKAKPDRGATKTGAETATATAARPANATATVVPSSTATAAASSTATAAASATATAAPSATVAPSTPPGPDTPDDLSALLSFQAYLTVTSSVDAEVVVQGQSAGRTNTRLLVRCGPRNVRLRGEGSAWLSEGQHVQIDCMKHARVSIDPAK